MKKRVDLPEKKYEGYIFDLDGTLVDSMPLHYRAWREALARAGAPDHVFRADEFYSCGGKSANDVVRFLNERYGMHMDAASTAADKRRIYLEMLEKEGMAAYPGSGGIRAFPGRRPQGDSYRERHAGSVPDSGCCRTFRPF